MGTPMYTNLHLCSFIDAPNDVHSLQVGYQIYPESSLFGCSPAIAQSPLAPHHCTPTRTCVRREEPTYFSGRTSAPPSLTPKERSRLGYNIHNAVRTDGAPLPACRPAEPCDGAGAGGATGAAGAAAETLEPFRGGARYPPPPTREQRDTKALFLETWWADWEGPAIAKGWYNTNHNH